MKLSEDVKKYIIGIYLYGYDEGRRYQDGSPFLLKEGFEEAFRIIETGKFPDELKIPDDLNNMCYCQISGKCECGG